MSTPTLCGVCEAELAAYTCPTCGTAACETDFDVEHGCCVECLRSATGAGDLNESDLLR